MAYEPSLTPKQKIAKVLSSEEEAILFLKQFTKIKFYEFQNKLFTRISKLADQLGFSSASSIYSHVTTNEELFVDLGSFWVSDPSLGQELADSLTSGIHRESNRISSLLSQGKKGAFCISPRSAFVIVLLSDTLRGKCKAARHVCREIGIDFRHVKGGSKQATIDLILDIITKPIQGKIDMGSAKVSVQENTKKWQPLSDLAALAGVDIDAEIEDIGSTIKPSKPENDFSSLEQTSVFVDASVCRERRSTIISAYFPDTKEGVVEKFNLILNITTAEILALALGHTMRQNAKVIYTDCQNAYHAWEGWYKTKSFPLVAEDGYELTALLKSRTQVKWIPRERNQKADSLAQHGRTLPSGQRFWLKLTGNNPQLDEWKIDSSRLQTQEVESIVIQEILKDKIQAARNEIKAEFEAEFNQRLLVEKEKIKILDPKVQNASTPPPAAVINNLTLTDYMAEKLIPEYQGKIQHLQDKILFLENQIKDVMIEQTSVEQEMKTIEATMQILKPKN